MHTCLHASPPGQQGAGQISTGACKALVVPRRAGAVLAQAHHIMSQLLCCETDEDWCTSAAAPLPMEASASSPGAELHR